MSEPVAPRPVPTTPGAPPDDPEPTQPVSSSARLAEVERELERLHELERRWQTERTQLVGGLRRVEDEAAALPTLRHQLDSARQDAQQLQAELERAQAELEAERESARAERKELGDLREVAYWHDVTLGSLSWRVTAPLRLVAAVGRGARLRRGANGPPSPRDPR